MNTGRSGCAGWLEYEKVVSVDRIAEVGSDAGGAAEGEGDGEA